MSFEEDIKKFNVMYKLPSNALPALEIGEYVDDRIENFQFTIEKEVTEGDDIIDLVVKGANDLDILTKLADWHADQIIYNATEMQKYGLPIMEILSIIMQSNFSKLGEDGEPIYDERGKVLKGPNFYPPEPEIRALLEDIVRHSK